MAVKIRLKRIGRKKQPTYRIVVIESRNPRGGKVIESVGYYCPYLKDKPLKIDMEQVQRWRDKGAIPTEAVTRLLKRFRQESEGGAVGEIRKKADTARAKPAPVELAIDETPSEPVDSDVSESV